MKSWIRRSATWGLIGGVVLTSWLSQTFKVLGLPPEQVIELLQPIPVFTIADDQGSPLVAVGEDQQKYTGIFMSQNDAQQFFQQLQKDKPDIAQKVKVQPVSLGEIYKIQNSNANKPDSLKFAYVATANQIQSAQEILKANGQEYQGGVPLFVAKGGPDEGYLTIEQNNEQVIPFFFDRGQIQSMIDRFKQEQPEVAADVVIEVVPLESVMSTLTTSDDEMLTKIRFVPSAESQQFLQQVLQQNQNQSP